MRRILRATAAATAFLVILAIAAGTAISAIRIVRPRPTVFGYQLGDHSKRAEMESVVARFGKTYMSGYFGHSMAPVYRTSDRKAYVVFSWSDGGLETVLVTREFSGVYKPPTGAHIRTISIPSTSIKADKGIKLGDSQARVRRLLGKPEISGDKGTHWTYVSEWYIEPGKSGQRYSVFDLDLKFKKNRLVSMEGRQNEP